MSFAVDGGGGLLAAMSHVGAVLPTIFLCATASAVAAASVDGILGYRKCMLIGAGVGLVPGAVISYLLKIIEALSSLPEALLPVQLERFGDMFVGTVFTVLVAALAGAVVGGQAARVLPSSHAILRCTTVGGIFGLVVCIAQLPISLVLMFFVLPPDGQLTLTWSNVLALAAVVTVAGIAIKVALAVVAVRLVRRRRNATSPTTPMLT